MFTRYAAPVEQAMRFTFSCLNERQRRLYAATEALKLGYGGIAYIAQLLGCHRKTVQRGLLDLQNPVLPLQARKKGVGVALVCRSFPDWTKPF